MSGLSGLVDVANQYTGIMVAMLWVAAAIGYRLLDSDIQDNGADIEALAEDHEKVQDDLQRVDQKQDHIVSRQEMMLERMGMNEQEIQELREETARLDERHDSRDDFYRGPPSDPGDD